ncbi:MAG: hypothetical protein PUH86_11995 [Lachnospiraceae bacterium]|nr:hypothetical protein [Lachnospiraceae bacterium]
MKKKLAAIVMAGALSASMLCACGSESQPEKAAETVETVAETTEKAAAETEETGTKVEFEELEKETPEAADGEEVDKAMMVDDETFADLQESYEIVLDMYNEVVDLYNKDEVAADPYVEKSLTNIKKTLTTIGDKSQGSMSMQDALKLMETLDKNMGELDKLVDRMKLAE